jgi:hypothetical protein
MDDQHPPTNLFDIEPIHSNGHKETSTESDFYTQLETQIQPLVGEYYIQLLTNMIRSLPVQAQVKFREAYLSLFEPTPNAKTLSSEDIAEITLDTISETLRYTQTAEEDPTLDLSELCVTSFTKNRFKQAPTGNSLFLGLNTTEVPLNREETETIRNLNELQLVFLESFALNVARRSNTLNPTNPFLKLFLKLSDADEIATTLDIAPENRALFIKLYPPRRKFVVQGRAILEKEQPAQQAQLEEMVEGGVRGIKSEKREIARTLGGHMAKIVHKLFAANLDPKKKKQLKQLGKLLHPYKTGADDILMYYQGKQTKDLDPINLNFNVRKFVEGIYTPLRPNTPSLYERTLDIVTNAALAYHGSASEITEIEKLITEITGLRLNGLIGILGLRADLLDDVDPEEHYNALRVYIDTKCSGQIMKLTQYLMSISHVIEDTALKGLEGTLEFEAELQDPQDKTGVIYSDIVHSETGETVAFRRKNPSENPIPVNILEIKNRVLPERLTAKLLKTLLHPTDEEWTQITKYAEALHSLRMYADYIFIFPTPFGVYYWKSAHGSLDLSLLEDDVTPIPVRIPKIEVPI